MSYETVLKFLDDGVCVQVEVETTKQLVCISIFEDASHITVTMEGLASIGEAVAEFCGRGSEAE